MLSLREVARRTLGLTGGFSVTSDVFGYIFRDADGSVFGALAAADTLPGSGQATTRSLTRHLQTIRGPAFEMVPIFVGFRSDFTGTVTQAQTVRAQYTVQVARDIYAQQGLGIRRLNWQAVPEAQVGGFAFIENRAEAKNLTDAWSGPDGGIDVFLVQTIGDADGWSSVPGSCDKNDTANLSGPVLEITQGSRLTGILMAHETGHYLGLAGATDGAGNLMGTASSTPGVDSINANSTGLTDAQGTTMRAHCSVSIVA
ncbi:MAG: hypothetical protein ACM3ZF_05290 [Mycobacterium leprae]